MSRRVRYGLVVGLLLATLLYFWVGKAQSDRQRMSSVTSFSNASAGLLYLRKTAPEVILWQRPFLEAKDYKDFRRVLIFSPTMSFSAREAKTLATYVREGGHLVLSAHDDRTLTQLDGILRALKWEAPTEKRPTFQNGTTTTVIARRSDVFFKAGETYEFYSPLRFQNCEDGGEARVDCFSRTTGVGQGQATLLLGLPVWSNVLITRQDNRKAGFRLLKPMPILIDEYHHFFSDRTLADLFKRPTFAMTIGGILVLLILFFAFSYSSLSFPRPKVVHISRGLGFHEFGEGLLARVIERGDSFHDALLQHCLYLESITHSAPPDFRARLQALLPQVSDQFSLQSFSERAKKLLELHAEWNQRKVGRRL